MPVNPYGAVERALERTRQTIGGLLQYQARREERRGLMGLKGAELGLQRAAIEERAKASRGLLGLRAGELGLRKQQMERETEEAEFQRWLKTPGTIDSIFKKGIKKGYIAPEQANALVDLVGEVGADTNMIVTPDDLKSLQIQLLKATQEESAAEKEHERDIEKLEREYGLKGELEERKKQLQTGKELKLSDYKGMIDTILKFYTKDKDPVMFGFLQNIKKSTDLESMVEETKNAYDRLKEKADAEDPEAERHLAHLESIYNQMIARLGIEEEKPETEPKIKTFIYDREKGFIAK